MRIPRNKTIIGSFVILTFFLLGVLRGIWPTEDRVAELQRAIQLKAQEYAEVSAHKLVEERHCSMSKELAAELLLLHGQAERMRSQLSLTLAALGKEGGVR